MKLASYMAALLLIASSGIATADPPVTAIQALSNTDTRLTVDLQDVPLTDALRVLSKQFGLSIITAKDVATNVNARFNDVTLREALDSLITINGYAYRSKGDVIEIFCPPVEKATSSPPCFATFPLRFAPAGRVRDIIKPFLTADIGRVEADLGSNKIIIYDLPFVVDSIAGVISEIDLPEAQITISAEIIEASMDLDERLGIDWQTRLVASGAAMPTTFPFNSRSSDSQFIPGNKPQLGTADDEFGDDHSFPFPEPADFTFGTLDATGLKAVLEILKTDSGTNLIANPEITTLNNHEAKINIGDTVPVPIYTTNLETGVSAVTGFEEVETGTILTVIPQVNNDGESVTMIVKPEISEITGYKGQYDERPIVSSRKAETTVRLRDGETLVIGGLVSVNKSDSITKIPVLGDIPLLGWLFKKKVTIESKSTLYIFITPRITNGAYTARAKKAGERLIKNGLKQPESGADDIRNPEASPFN